MKRNMPIRLGVIAAFSIAAASLSTCFAQGSLAPPGAPGPTFKTLSQIEPRTAITNTGFIGTSGSYYLATNITVGAENGIVILASDVTLDLNGFTISTSVTAGNAISIIGSRNIAILNGHITGGVTNNGGVFSGPGFANGIYFPFTSAPRNLRVTDVSVNGCAVRGIHLGDDFSSVVERCTVRTVGGEGIRAGTISQSTAKECGGSAIVGQTASHCYGQSTASYGLYVTTAENCTGESTSGTGLYAFSAVNCYGASSSSAGVNASSANACYGVSGTGDGLTADTANNCRGVTGAANSTHYGLYAVIATGCYGFAGGTAVGLRATATADSCYGEAASSDGVYAEIASNCYGRSNGFFDGVYAFFTANNCFGSSNGGDGVSTSIAIGCVGVSNTGTGLRATIANSCIGSSSSGSALSIVNKYNMP